MITGFDIKYRLLLVSGFRCQGLRFRINDTVNSTLVANKSFVFILNNTPPTLWITG